MPKYKVSGFCLVPMFAVIEVLAATPEKALEAAAIAWKSDKQRLIDHGSADELSAFDWRPTADPIKE